MCWREEFIGSWDTTTGVLPEVPRPPKPEPITEIVYIPTKRRKRRPSFAKWALAVKSRDGSCVRCGTVDDLAAHHIQAKSTHPEMAFDIANGEALCPPCHRLEHLDLPEVLFRPTL